VRLADVERAPLDKALFQHRASVEQDARRRRAPKSESNAAIDRLSVGTGLQGFGACDLVIEAVAERLDIKTKVFGELADSLASDAILATNTSSLSVDAIAATVRGKERVVGMHFFNPVPKMPLVEIVRGKHTSVEVVHATARLALKMGKTPVITQDRAGFVVNRLLGPYLDEAARLFEAGVAVERIDQAARDFGLPMGPLELLDEVGFDIASHAATSLQEAFGSRMRPSGLLQRLLDAGLKGKKTGAGFYVHGSKSKREERTVNSDVSRLRPAASGVLTDFSEQTMLDYMLMAMLNEAALALEEGVIAGPRELDLATVFGMGFPPFRGGLLRWADSLGARDVLARLQRIASAPDMLARSNGAERFKPAPMLRRLAETNARFHAPSSPA
jgi:3-hydroxyacyl-CoA dehydrogenase/enoyl-CoA hydratase/3-hydroxybutyryl-CoA epimerase